MQGILHWLYNSLTLSNMYANTMHSLVHFTTAANKNKHFWLIFRCKNINQKYIYKNTVTYKSYASSSTRWHTRFIFCRFIPRILIRIIKSKSINIQVRKVLTKTVFHKNFQTRCILLCL